MKVSNTFTLLAAALLSGLVFTLASSANAAVSLGSGFSCSGSSITKGSKTVSYSKAQSTLQATIAKLKKKLASAKGKSKKAIQAQIKATTTSKAQLKSCSSGKLAENEIDPVFTALAKGTGTFKGTYQGIVGGFLPISGDMTMTFIVDGTKFSGSLSLGGQLNSALNGKNLDFTNDVGGIGFPAKFYITDTFVGNVTVSFTQSGGVSITNDNAAKAINFSGQFTDPSITFGLTGTYNGINFTGSSTLSRQ